MGTADGTGTCARPRRPRTPGQARAGMPDSRDRLVEKIERGADRCEAIALAVVRPLVLLHDRVIVAVHRDVRESDLLPRRRPSWSGNAGDAEADLRPEPRTCPARVRAGHHPRG